jgi:hypothetical protein
MKTILGILLATCLAVSGQSVIKSATIYSASIPVYVAPTYAPSITGDLIAQKNVTNTVLNFNIEASGTAPLAYQWNYATTNVPGATLASFSTNCNPITTVQTNNVFVVITNSYGSITSSTVTAAWTNGSGAATFSDNFNRTETPLSNGDKWFVGVDGGVAINTDGSKAVCAGGSGYANAMVTNLTFSANQKSTITLSTTTLAGPSVRYQSDGKNYTAWLKNTTTIAYYKSAPSWSNLGEFVINPLSAGDMVTLSVTGTTTTVLTVYTNGVEVSTMNDTDTPITTGQPGMQIQSEGAIDAFSAEDL